jgi:uncharacterized tellurite resistance protein B-like protein
MDSEHKLFAIYLLKRLAMADETYQISEQAYVDQAAAHLGLDRRKLNDIDPEKYQVSSMPSREQDRMTILYYLLFLSEADGVMLSEEKLEIRKIGFELGFRDEHVKKMIEIVDQNKSTHLHPDELLRVIKIALN